ncbi:MAG: hypothetical protein ACYDCO_10745 [Armatimonadota bacterium]
MWRGWLLTVMILAWLPCQVFATGAGKSGAETQYFNLDVPNREYTPDERRPTAVERVREVTGYWRFFLQAYRAVECDPSLRQHLKKTHPVVQLQSNL